MKRFSDSLRSSELLRSTELIDEVEEPTAHGPDYIDHLEAIHRKAAKRGVVLYARISDPRPGTRETTSSQLKAADDKLKALEQELGCSIIVHKKFAEEVSGWKWAKDERAELIKAVKLAKKLGAVLVAFDPSRFVRNENCQFQVEPTVNDYKQLMKLVGDVQLATIADPNIHEDRSRSTIRGLKNAKAAKNDAGAGHKKRRRGRIRSEVLELMDAGVGNREIGRQLDLPEPTVRRWRKRYHRYEGASFLKA